VIQVPDFGERFWMYQAVDLRTDSFVDLGLMYGTTPGFYMLVGPDWKGEPPKGIANVFRSPTYSGMVGPRVFQDDTPDDNRIVQDLVSGVDMYPLTEFDGTMKRRDWRKTPDFPATAAGKEETRWVFPEQFLDQLPLVLRDAPPLPGEEARYAEMFALVAAAQKDAALKEAITDEAAKADQELVAPLLQFRHFGIPLTYNWTTANNGIRHRLLHTHGGGQVEHSRQQAERGQIFLSGPRRRRRQAEWPQKVHSDVRKKSDSACQRILVVDGV
jgi:hypothetical protein